MKLKKHFLLILLSLFFSTNILLSFTPETYTYTLFLLVLFNYYTAIKFKKDQKKNNFDLYDEDLWFKLHYGMTRQEFIQKYSNNLKSAPKTGAFTTFINNVISKFRKMKERINLWRRRSNT